MVAVDVFFGPVAFAVIAFIPAALSQLAQLRSLAVSRSIHGVSLWWLAYCVVNQVIWLTWSMLAHEISVMIVATGLGTLMTLNLILAVLRRLNFVRPGLSFSDGPAAWIGKDRRPPKDRQGAPAAGPASTPLARTSESTCSR